jgi:hypothetical protein
MGGKEGKGGLNSELRGRTVALLIGVDAGLRTLLSGMLRPIGDEVRVHRHSSQCNGKRLE